MNASRLSEEYLSFEEYLFFSRNDDAQRQESAP